MDGDDAHRALLRIDSALARLEAAALQPAQSGDPAGNGDLAARHEQLRSAVTAVLGRLDTLISEQSA